MAPEIPENIVEQHTNKNKEVKVRLQFLCETDTIGMIIKPDLCNDSEKNTQTILFSFSFFKSRYEIMKFLITRSNKDDN